MKNTVFTDYFPNLFPYRSLIIAYVVLCHIMMSLSTLDVRYRKIEFLHYNSDALVVLLYILSGFLITYILLREKTRTNTIGVISFYKRRLLRIYPLYFICISLSYAIFYFPGSHMPILGGLGGNNLLTPGYEYLALVFLGPHILFSLKENALALHTWTVGAEENFYQIWAPLIKKMKNFYWLFLLIAISPVAEFFLYRATLHTDSPWPVFFLHFNNYFRLSCLAIGGLGCYLYLKHPEYIRICRNRWLQYAALIIILFFLLSGVRFGLIFYEMISVLFLIIVLGNIEKTGNPLHLEYKPLIFFGKLSYGIYLFHPICIGISVCVLNLFIQARDHLILYALLLTLMTFFLTVLFSLFLNQYIEKRFYRRSGENTAKPASGEAQ